MQDFSPIELGATGLKHDNHYIFEEFLPQLASFQLRMKFYREMIDNDPVVGACMSAIKMIVKQATWHVDAADDTNEAMRAKVFVEEALSDMENTWPQTVSRALSMAGYGFSLFEILYKRRQGWVGDESFSSKYDDSAIGWRNFAVRSQDSVHEWLIDDYGRYQGFIQQAAPLYKMVPIPGEKTVLFRSGDEKDSPEGKSAIRNSVRPYWFKKRLEEIEAIGIERDLNGIPIAKVPSRVMSQSATDEERRVLAGIKGMLDNLKNARGAGIIWPNDYDAATGKPFYEIELMSSRGRRTHDTNTIINRYNKAIAASMLADFILIGHENVGSFALASAKTHLFSVAIGSYLEEIRDVMNKVAIPRLLRLNGMFSTPSPMMRFSDIETIELDNLARYVSALSGAGIDLRGEDIQGYLKEQMGAPDSDANVYDDEEDEEDDID